LLHHSTNAASALKRWEYLDIHLEPSHFVVFIVEIDQFMDKYHALPAQEIELIRFSLQNIMEETIAGSTKGMIFRESILRYVVVMNSSNSQTSADIAEACRLNIEQYTRFTVSIGVGLEVAGIQDLPASYQQALTSLSYHFYTEGNGVFSYTNIPRKSRGVPNYSFSKEQEFLFALRSGNSEKSKLLLEEIFNELVALEPLPEPKYVENVCYELASKIFRVILEKFPYESVQQLEGQIHDIQNKDQPSLQELKSLLSNLCSEGCGWIEKERSHESTRIIHQAKAYISANLHMDLSLEHCAKQVNLSQGYFSNLFKKVLGISFQQFVIQEKMEKAKSMLIGDYQVQEIAQELGYEHRRYFSDIFKKYTGMTPSEFKMSYIGKP
jgi:two-component system response regulator YesN